MLSHLLLLVFTTAFLSVSADDNTYPIKSFVLNGSGCPPGSVSSLNLGNAIVANFTTFKAALGYGVEPSKARRNCQATITVTPYDGYRFYPGETIFSGTFDIDAQVTETRTTLYYFQGSIQQETSRNSVTGPQSMSYTIHDTFSGSGPTSDCGETSIVNIELAVALDNGSSNNAGVGSVSQAKFGNFVFERC